MSAVVSTSEYFYSLVCVRARVQSCVLTTAAQIALRRTSSAEFPGGA